MTHNNVDYNPDHELTSKIIRDIAVMIPIAKLKTKSVPCDKIPSIFYWDAVNDINFNPTEYVDISGVIELKKTMCAEHVSQVQWMKDNYKEAVGESDANFLDDTLVVSRFRGLQHCGDEHADQ